MRHSLYQCKVTNDHHNNNGHIAHFNMHSEHITVSNERGIRKNACSDKSEHEADFQKVGVQTDSDGFPGTNNGYDISHNTKNMFSQENFGSVPSLVHNSDSGVNTNKKLFPYLIRFISSVSDSDAQAV